MSTADVLKLLASALTAVATAGAGAFGLWLARWKIDELSREQLTKQVADQRLFLDEKERILAALRDQVERLGMEMKEQAARTSELNDQLREAGRRDFHRERWIRRVADLCQRAGVDLPPREP